MQLYLYIKSSPRTVKRPHQNITANRTSSVGDRVEASEINSRRGRVQQRRASRGRAGRRAPGAFDEVYDGRKLKLKQINIVKSHSCFDFWLVYSMDCRSVAYVYLGGGYVWYASSGDAAVDACSLSIGIWMMGGVGPVKYWYGCDAKYCNTTQLLIISPIMAGIHNSPPSFKSTG